MGRGPKRLNDAVLHNENFTMSTVIPFRIVGILLPLFPHSISVTDSQLHFRFQQASPPSSSPGPLSLDDRSGL